MSCKHVTCLKPNIKHLRMILILSVLTTIFTNIPFHISISLQIPCIGRSHQGQPLETSTWHAQLSANDTSPLTSLRAVLVLWHQMKGIYWIINTALRNQSVYRNTFWLNQNQLKSKFATCNIQVTFFFLNRQWTLETSVTFRSIHKKVID